MERKITQQNIEEFRRSLIEDEKSLATIEKYIRDVRAFQRFLADKRLNKEIVIEYKNWLMERYAPSSVNSMLAALNRFLKGNGWYDCTVKAVKVQRQAFRMKEKELSKDEYFRLLKAAEQKGDIRLSLIMQTICATGIRVSELEFITVDAVKKSYASVNLKGKTRLVLIPESLQKELTWYIEMHGIKSGKIFVTRSGKVMDRSNILHAMKALCLQAGVDERKVFPHNLRHLFACLYYKAEKNLSHLADILGHSNINTTRIYTSVSGVEQRHQIEKLGLVVMRKNIPHNIHYVLYSKEKLQKNFPTKTSGMLFIRKHNRCCTYLGLCMP